MCLIDEAIDCLGGSVDIVILCLVVVYDSCGLGFSIFYILADGALEDVGERIVGLSYDCLEIFLGLFGVSSEICKSEVVEAVPESVLGAV